MLCIYIKQGLFVFSILIDTLFGIFINKIHVQAKPKFYYLVIIYKGQNKHRHIEYKKVLQGIKVRYCLSKPNRISYLCMHLKIKCK